METNTTAANGKSEKIGELRGEIRALIRQFEAMSADFNALKQSLDKARGEIDNHMAIHSEREKQAERREIGNRWWAGVGMAVSGTVAGLIVKFWS